MRHSKISFPDCRKIHFRDTCILKISQGSMSSDPPRGSGRRPSILQVTCLLTRQCPSTSKVNENPETGLLELEVEGGD